MKALTLKLFRELGRLKGQAAAIAILVALGVAVFVGSISTQRSLESSRAAYYEQFRFGHVFASVAVAPKTLAHRIGAIGGVRDAEFRLAANATLRVPGFDEPVTARVLSLPGAQPGLGRIYLRKGRLPAAGSLEAVVSEAFAEAQGLQLGETVVATIDGRRYRLRLVGIGLSPEFIYTVRPGDLMPDNLRFGVLWTDEQLLAGALGQQDAFNDVMLRLEADADERVVIDKVDDLLSTYGGTGAYGRDRHVSHRFLSDELAQLASTSVFVPSIFLGVAVFLLNVIIGRIVSLQRATIATLKALGYRSTTVGFHYASMAGIIVAVGSLLGGFGGYLFGVGMTEMYAGYYRIPVASYTLEPILVIGAALSALLASLIGTLASVRRVVRMQPAEAMRPAPPERYGRSLLERLGIGRWLSTEARMILRQLARHPMRTLLSSMGVAMAVALLIVGSFFGDALSYIINTQFHRAERQDVTVVFTQPLAPEAVAELRQLAGVLEAEPFRTVSAELSLGSRSHRTAISGYSKQGHLRRVLTSSGQVVGMPERGLMLSETLSNTLQASPGDQITVTLLEGSREVHRASVSALVDEAFGASAYASLGSLTRLVDRGPRVSGALLRIDPQQRSKLFRSLRERPFVQSVTQRQAMVESFEKLSAEMLLIFSGMLTLFASAMAGGIVYNSMRVALAERERELGTLRVVGFTRAEVSRLLLGEVGTSVALALPLGCAIGWLLAVATAESVTTEMYRIPAVIEPSTFASAILIVSGVSVVVALLVRRRLDRLDLMGVLKTRE